MSEFSELFNSSNQPIEDKDKNEFSASQKFVCCKSNHSQPSPKKIKEYCLLQQNGNGCIHLFPRKKADS